jgi:DNA-binding transcriptional MerR regulator
MEDLRQLAQQDPIWSLEEFAHVTNTWLPRFLPEEKTNSRVREEVNPRLVRQYTTLGMVDPPLKEGREARYTYRHLLQLLVTRRLLAEGYGSAVIAKLLAGREEAALESVLEGQTQITVAPENPALAFLQGLTDRVMSKKAAPPPPQAPPAARRGPAPQAAPSPAAPPPAALARKAAAEVPPEPLEMLQEKELEEVEALGDFLKASESAPSLDYLTLSEPYSPSGSTWTRHELAPGLELHIRSDFSTPDFPPDRQAIADAVFDALQADDDRRS